MKRLITFFIVSGLLFSVMAADYSLQFDGSNDYVDCGTTSNFELTNVSIEAWVYLEANGTYQSIVSKLEHSGSREGYELLINNTSQIMFSVGNNWSDWSSATSSTTLSINTWYHIAGTYDGSTIRIYINGVEDGNASYTNGITNSIYALNLARRPNGSQYFTGKLDEVKIWSDARTSTEIQNNMNTDVTGQSNLVAYYKMSDGTGTSLTDNSGNGNTGTLTNMDNSDWVDGMPVKPTVTTQSASSITATTATGNGAISDLGNPNPTQHGVCWNTSGNPSTSDSLSQEGSVSETGAFTSSITGLSPNTTYYIKAYATNSAGTGYGSQVSFTTSKKQLTISGTFTANNKTYDSTNDATINNNSLSLSGIVGGDDVSLTNIVLDFATVQAGSNIEVNISSAALSGTDKDNYTLSLTGAPTTNADITPKGLTVTGANAENKTYDGNTNAVITGASLSGLVLGDDVSISDSAGTFAQATADSGIAVSANIVVTGADSANYTLTQPAGLTADISAKELILSGSFTVQDKIHDGNTDATISDNQLILNGIAGSDLVSIDSVVAAFESADTDTNITVNLTNVMLSGADKDNYIISLIGAPTTKANIYTLTNIKTLDYKNIKVYPNPTYGQLTIKTSASGQCKIQIINCQGDLVYSEKQKTDPIMIDISSYPAGNYIIQIINKENIFINNIIKQ